MFTNWDNAIEPFRTKYPNLREKSITDPTRLIIPRVDSLRQSIGKLFYLQEKLRIQEISRKRLLQLDGLRPESDGWGHGARQRAPQHDPNDDAPTPAREVLVSRLVDMEDELSMQSLRLTLYAEQYKNLIELEFNIANAKMGVRVAALSYLAFLFTPISFVSSMFGISSVDWNVSWFAIAAFLVALLSLLFWFAVDLYFGRNELPFASKDSTASYDISSDKIRASGIDRDKALFDTDNYYRHHRHGLSGDTYENGTTRYGHIQRQRWGRARSSTQSS
jgi:hypothetical protein